MEALISADEKLLVPTEGGEGFSQHYDEALQRDPDVVFAHAAVAKLSGHQPAARPDRKDFGSFAMAG